MKTEEVQPRRYSKYVFTSRSHMTSATASITMTTLGAQNPLTPKTACAPGTQHKSTQCDDQVAFAEELKIIYKIDEHVLHGCVQPGPAAFARAHTLGTHRHFQPKLHDSAGTTGKPLARNNKLVLKHVDQLMHAGGNIMNFQWPLHVGTRFNVEPQQHCGHQGA